MPKRTDGAQHVSHVNFCVFSTYVLCPMATIYGNNLLLDVGSRGFKELEANQNFLSRQKKLRSIETLHFLKPALCHGTFRIMRSVSFGIYYEYARLYGIQSNIQLKCQNLIFQVMSQKRTHMNRK